MIVLSAKIRKSSSKKNKILRDKGIIPAILYGPEIKEPFKIEVDYKDFEKAYREGGESSIIDLDIKELKESSQKALIKDIVEDPMTGKIMHVDFYQPRLKEETTAFVPIIFEGDSPAIKETGGTFVKNITELEVKALPEKLPKEFKIDIGVIKTLDDRILVEDLSIPEGVEILKDPEETIALVTPPEKVEEELEKPIEEDVDKVEKVEEKEKEEEQEESEEEKEDNKEEEK